MIDSKKYVKGSFLASVFLSFAYLYGDCCAREADFVFNIVIAAEVLFFALFYFLAINLLYLALCKLQLPGLFKESFSKAFRKKAFLYSFLLFLAVWLFHLILKYPAGNSVDGMGEIRIEEGIRGISKMHPVFHALILNLFLKLGILLGNINTGIFLLVLFEMIVRALIFAYAIKLLADMRASDTGILMAVLFFALCPYIAGYVGISSKDAWCTDFVVLLFVLLAYYISDEEKFFAEKRNVILLVAAVTFASLFRNNGAIITMPAVAVIAVIEIKKRGFKKQVFTLFLAFIIPALVTLTMDLALDTSPMLKGETLSLPLQQTSRFVVYHSDLLTEEEKQIIDNVLPYDEIPNLYNETLSDPVKSAVYADVTDDEISAFLSLWLRLFFRSPSCYLTAVVRQNIYMFYPKYHSFYSCYPIYPNSEYSDVFPNYFESNESIQTLLPSYKEMLANMHGFLYLSPLGTAATYVILLLALMLIAKKNRDKKIFIVFLPAIITVVEVLFAANISVNDRYLFPLIWSTPVWFGTFAARCRSIDSKLESDIISNQEGD